MSDVIIHLTTTIISGCIVAIFTNWLRIRNNKKDDR
ncbi:type I toxin-antitoxin system Fst family toxin [Staphylococcus warneri]|nr:type I toxin-antitoxin system Fst family toxin [Staphylococcus warneri]MBJ7884849.1 type I toxin-antitoxin system Fst family toxin [Bacillaceae bacterium HSR45]